MAQSGHADRRTKSLLLEQELTQILQLYAVGRQAYAG